MEYMGGLTGEITGGQPAQQDDHPADVRIGHEHRGTAQMPDAELAAHPLLPMVVNT